MHVACTKEHWVATWDYEVAHVHTEEFIDKQLNVLEAFIQDSLPHYSEVPWEEAMTAFNHIKMHIKKIA